MAAEQEVGQVQPEGQEVGQVQPEGEWVDHDEEAEQPAWPRFFKTGEGTKKLPKHTTSGWASDSQLYKLAHIPVLQAGTEQQADISQKQALIALQQCYLLSQIERSLYFMEGRQDATSASDEDVWRHRDGLAQQWQASKSAPEKAASMAELRQYNRVLWRQRARGTFLYSCFACWSFVGQSVKHLIWQMTQ